MKRVLIASLAVVALAGWGTVYADMIGLDEAAQGKGNKGLSWRPLDAVGDPVDFVLSARSSIDSSQPLIAGAAGLAGTVYVDRKGTGVQTADAHGSKGISGGGGHKDEELIFTYDAPVYLNSITLGLNDIEFGSGMGDKDDPIVFLSLAGSGTFGVTILEAEVFGAFTSTGRKMGLVDFGSFTSLPGGTGIDAVKIRETNDHIYVNIADAPHVPEPTTLALLGFGGLAMLGRRKRAC